VVRRALQLKSLRTQVVAIAVGVIALQSVVAALLLRKFEEPLLGVHPGQASALFAVGLCAIAVASLLSVSAFAVAARFWILPLRNLGRAVRGVAASVAEGRPTAADLGPQPARELQDLAEAFTDLIRQTDRARREQEDAHRVLAERTNTVDRLLDFSQTIQGAGKAEQVFNTLTHFLRTELALEGIAVLNYESRRVPAMQVASCWPDGLVQPDVVADVDAALCPCLRQNLPRLFRPGATPVRCGLDAALTLPTDRPAFCIPFAIGPGTQVLVHMLLPASGSWTDEKRQLAQAYTNAAHSALTSLHLLAEAEKQSMIDALTGLYNRRSMESLLLREIGLAERHGHPLSVVMIDMDLFKHINDAHGHAAGDHLLKAFADCVRMTLRATDLAFRYGGDEFVIALPQTPLTQAQQAMEKLRQAFATVDFSDAIAHLEHAPTLSIGVAERAKATGVLTLSDLLSAADQALYSAKSESRNCVRIFAPQRAA
jgi:diguanylate cyclase (GGDEF)-like protein